MNNDTPNMSAELGNIETRSSGKLKFGGVYSEYESNLSSVVADNVINLHDFSVFFTRITEYVKIFMNYLTVSLNVEKLQQKVHKFL